MINAIVKVGKTHCGDLVPGTLLVVKIDPKDSKEPYVYFSYDGGWSHGKLIALTTLQQDLLIDNPG